MQTQLKAYLIAETADLLAAEAEEAVIMRAEAEALDRLAKAVAKALETIKADAVAAGYAAITETTRENPPSKDRYIELHGQAAFNAHKTVSAVRRFGWLF
jgi:hypothetical protein